VLADFWTATRNCGIDVPFLVGFLVAIVLGIWPGNWLVAQIHKWQLKTLLKPDGSKTFDEFNKEYDDLLKLFDWRFAQLIGRTERILYVIAVMTAQYSILSGWLVMKAFFGWLSRPRRPQSESLPYYHMYLFGNALSILCGLLCGSIGNVVVTAFNHLLRQYMFFV
jgi:hypothetical protein